MQGSKELIARLDGLGRIDSKIRGIVRDEANQIKVRAQAGAPVDTGALRKGMNVNMTGNASQSKAVISANAYSKKRFNYGLYQEYNHKSKSDFMENAYKSRVASFKLRVAQAVKER